MKGGKELNSAEPQNCDCPCFDFAVAGDLLCCVSDGLAGFRSVSATHRHLRVRVVEANLNITGKRRGLHQINYLVPELRFDSNRM